MATTSEDWDAWECRAVEAFGDSIRTARTGRGLSQQGLADLIGVSKGVITNLETKGRVAELPKLGLILKLAVALEVSPAQLLYPNLPDGQVEFIPGATTRALDAVSWFSGEDDRPTSTRLAGLMGSARELEQARSRARELVMHLDYRRMQLYPKNSTVAEIRSGAVKPREPDSHESETIRHAEASLDRAMQLVDQLSARIIELGGVIDEDA